MKWNLTETIIFRQKWTSIVEYSTKDNLKNYIPPQFDFEAYECQPIEADANYFADSVMKKGQNSHLYA